MIEVVQQRQIRVIRLSDSSQSALRGVYKKSGLVPSVYWFDQSNYTDLLKLFSGMTNVIDKRLMRFIGIDITDWTTADVYTDAAQAVCLLSSQCSSLSV